jgi:hypothetical protein
MAYNTPPEDAEKKMFSDQCEHSRNRTRTREKSFWDPDVGAGIQQECDAQNKPVPRDLWHAVLFYTTGEVVKRRLAEDGIGEYVPYAYQHGLYTRSWTRFRGVLEQAWQSYLDGTISFEDALRNMVAAL